MSTYFTEKFKQLRKAASLTQEETANIFNVSPQAVSRWETGANYPDVEMLPHIAIYFKVTVDELLGTETIRGVEDSGNLKNAITDLHHKGKYDEAISMARKAIKKYPLDIWLQYQLVNVLIHANKKEDTVGKHTAEIISICQRIISFADYRDSLYYRVELIRLYAEEGMKNEAKKLLDTLPNSYHNVSLTHSGLILEGEEWLKNQKSSIFQAMLQLEDLLIGYPHLYTQDTDVILKFRKTQVQVRELLGEIIYDNPAENINHFEFALTNAFLAEQYCNMGDMENAILHIEKATEDSLHHIDCMDNGDDYGRKMIPDSGQKNLPGIVRETLGRAQFDNLRKDARFVKCIEILESNTKELFW